MTPEAKPTVPRPRERKVEETRREGWGIFDRAAHGVDVLLLFRIWKKALLYPKFQPLYPIFENSPISLLCLKIASKSIK